MHYALCKNLCRNPYIVANHTQNHSAGENYFNCLYFHFFLINSSVIYQKYQVNYSRYICCIFWCWISDAELVFVYGFRNVMLTQAMWEYARWFPAEECWIGESIRWPDQCWLQHEPSLWGAMLAAKGQHFEQFIYIKHIYIKQVTM